MTDAVIKQHLIDPEICIRCNTCESICPVSAITHDSRNYVVDVSKCNWCNDCISPCPTGSIDNYRKVPRAKAYTLEEQLGWDELPAELSVAELTALAGEAGDDAATAAPVAEPPAPMADPTGQTAFNSAQYGTMLPPWSAAHAYTNLYGPKAAEKNRHRHSGRQRARHRGRQGLRHAPHRAGLREHAIPGAGGAVDRHHPAGRRCRRTGAPRAPVFDCQPAQRRAPGLQQPLADRQTRAGRPPGTAGARRRLQLPVRPEGRRQGAGDRPVWRELPDAQPSTQPHRDDLHGHRQRTHARHDGVAPAAARQRQVRERQADAVFRRADPVRSCRTSGRCKACRRTSSTSTSPSRARRAVQSVTCRT
jgi:ferredoxin